MPGSSTSWLTPAGVLMTGKLDPMQLGERRLAVDVSRVEPRSGRRPFVTPIGRWCWDTVGQQVPAPCPEGVNDAFDTGPHGSLPALLPRADINRDTITTYDTWQEGSTSLHFVEDPARASSRFEQVFDVVGTIDGHDVSARAGTFNPILFTKYVDLGDGVRGLAVIDDGPRTQWHLLSYVDGRLVPLPVSGGLRPGVDAVPKDGVGYAAVHLGRARQPGLHERAGSSADRRRPC